jgi:uncharacterized protein YggU (UPF0235/DUF167 family)
MVPSADLQVRVQPRASRTEVIGWRDEVLALRVTAAPVEDAANQACRKLLAELLDVAPSQVTLVAGGKAREKRFRVSGLTPAALQAKIDECLSKK